jgi:hypothetical protein
MRMWLIIVVAATGLLVFVLFVLRDTILRDAVARIWEKIRDAFSKVCEQIAAVFRTVRYAASQRPAGTGAGP